MSQHEGDPDRIWEAIRQSPLFMAYVWELHWLAANVASIAEDVFAATVVEEDDGTDQIGVDPAVHAQLDALLGDAAKIRALIEHRAKLRRQSTLQYAVQQRRIGALRDLIDGLDIEATLAADARHSLEHFDERLDVRAVDFATGRAPLPMNVPFNMYVSRRRALLVLRGDRTPKPKLFPLRVYIGEERVFINDGLEVDIGKIHAECCQIRDLLAEAIPEDLREGRGAIVIPLTKDSFRAQDPE